MEEVIRDGALRLMTSEATCDVILNCQGHRLMAHKIMLSIASPLLQELLLADQCETSVLVLPDITASTMAYILDYIYTGSVILHSTVLNEFLSVANLLKLKIELNSSTYNSSRHPTDSETSKYFNKYYSQPTNLIYPKGILNCAYKNSECGPECYKLPPVYQSFKSPNDEKDYLAEKRLKFSPIILQNDRNFSVVNPEFCDDKPSLDLVKTVELEEEQSHVVNLEMNGAKRKTIRKMPSLMPISRCQISAFKARRGLYNRVFPSPWCPRIIPVTVDPRNECFRSQFPPMVPNGTFQNIDHDTTEYFEDQNDKNNNLKRIPSAPFNPLHPVPPAEKHLSPFRTTPTVLNLNISYKDISNYDSQKVDTSKTIDTANNNLIISENNKIECDSQEIKSNRISDYQSVPVICPVETLVSEYSESSNSNCSDGKSGEEFIKVDVRSDEDNGKEDADMSDQKQKPYKCEDCGKQFSQLRNYKYHRSVHEGTKEFAARCPECGKVFNDRGYLSSHLKIHRDRKEYGCPHCPKRFNQRVAYNMHLRIHTGVKPHVCPTCGKGFSRKMLLKQHQRVHTGERPYQCPECGKSFADRSNMSLHARLHTGVKPYACSLCPKSFTKKHHLKTHMNYHTGLKPYVCQKCGLTFSQSSNMRTHYKKCIQKDSSDANIP